MLHPACTSRARALRLALLVRTESRSRSRAVRGAETCTRCTTFPPSSGPTSRPRTQSRRKRVGAGASRHSSRSDVGHAAAGADGGAREMAGARSLRGAQARARSRTDRREGGDASAAGRRCGHAAPTPTWRRGGSCARRRRHLERLHGFRGAPPREEPLPGGWGLTGKTLWHACGSALPSTGGSLYTSTEVSVNHIGRRTRSTRANSG